jgi:hypothetical protein
VPPPFIIATLATVIISHPLVLVMVKWRCSGALTVQAAARACVRSPLENRMCWSESACLVIAAHICITMSASSSHGSPSQDETSTPLNVFRGSESGQSDLDSPRRLSTYQVAARKSLSSLDEELSANEQSPSPRDASKDGQLKFELKTHAMTVGWQRAAFSYFEENTPEQKTRTSQRSFRRFGRRGRSRRHARERGACPLHGRGTRGRGARE